MIRTKVKLTEQALETDFSSVSLQRLDEETLMIGRPVLHLPERQYTAAISDLIRYMRVHELDQGHPVGGLFAREQILKKEFYNYTHFYMKTEEGIENRDLHIKPKGLYAVGYQIGMKRKRLTAASCSLLKSMGWKWAIMHMKNICLMRLWRTGLTIRSQESSCKSAIHKADAAVHLRLLTNLV